MRGSFTRTTLLSGALSGMLTLVACGDGSVDAETQGASTGASTSGDGATDNGATGIGATGNGAIDGDGAAGSTRVALRNLGDREVFFQEVRGALLAQRGDDDYFGGDEEGAIDAGTGAGTDGGGGSDTGAGGVASPVSTDGSRGEAAAAPEADASTTTADGPNVTGTNVQEVGVDEQDRVKVSADGTRLYVLNTTYPGDFYPIDGEPVVIDDIETGEPLVIETGGAAVDSAVAEPFAIQTMLRVLGLDADAADATALRDVDVDLNGRQAQGMYLHETDSNSQIILTSSSNGYWGYWDEWGRPDAFGGIDSMITRIDVDDPANAGISGNVSIDGQIVSSRRIGPYLFVASRFYPRLPGRQPWEQTADEWRDAVGSADEADLLPHVTDVSTGEREPLVEPESCFVAARPDGDEWYSPDIVTLSVLDLRTMEVADSECYLGASETLYASPDAVYLATTRWNYGLPEDGSRSDSGVETDIHQFDIEAGSLRYRASGSVRGHLGFDELRKPFRMSEQDGYLRVATINDQGDFGFADGIADGGFFEGDAIEPGAPGSGGTTGDAATPDNTEADDGGTDDAAADVSDGGTQPLDIGPISLTILAPDDNGSLQRIAELPNAEQPAHIGKPGEQLYASRFLGNRAYLVTFRQTDPLYIVDLTDPREPALLSELEVEGYSDYLLPISQDYLLGIGRDALVLDDGRQDARGGFVLGVKLSLFDVSDPSAPREADTLLVGQLGTHSDALFDHRAITVQRATENHPTRVSFGIDVAGTAFPERRPTPNDPLNYYGWSYSGLHGFDVHADDSARIESRGALVVERVGPDNGYYGPRYRESRAVMVNDATYYVHGPDVFATTWDNLANPGPAR